LHPPLSHDCPQIQQHATGSDAARKVLVDFEQKIAVDAANLAGEQPDTHTHAHTTRAHAHMHTFERTALLDTTTILK
jgi:hypothetical protein